MFFQCTAPVAFAADDAILAESSIAVSSADSESVPADSDAGYIPEQSPENTSVDSSSMNEASSEPLTGDSSASSDLPEDASSNSSVESQPESDTDQISTSDETIDSELAESSSENTDESAKSLYQDGKILIYTYNQLAEIGSGQTLTDASGLAVTDENGAEITYALDAQYAIAEDIELTGDMLQWQLPEGFTGSITPLTENSDDLTLYDAQSDTIYLYNPYQLSVLQAEDPAKEPVLDGDAHADSFGMGQLIYPKGEDAPYLTYSLTHHYVISTQFSSEITDAPISVLDDSPAGSTDGRDFAGQVVKTIGDKTYILIGNEQQLRKIGSGDTVYGAVYQAIHHNAKWTIDHDSSGNLIMLYGGDADLTKEQNGTDNYTLGKDGIHAADKNLSDKASNILYVYTVGRCGVNQTTGKIDPNLDIDKAANQTYASNANYIIFRDIDLSSANWTPLTFQGTMIGAKSANGEKIWNDDSSAINTSTKPTISNVSVMQTGKLNVGKQMGVGFFSTISSEVSENDIGLSKGLVQVSNLKFQNISVQTTTSETYYPETLVSELTSTLGKLLGGVLSGLTFILTFGQVKIDLGKTLGDVLDARKKDPTALATGAIAGRVEGQVLFSGIEVVNADVKNVNNNTGGFVGYTVGVTEYDGLSNALGGLVKLLSNILNVIPGLGLGDLITILLGNAIPLDKLIPTGYINAKFVDCSIDGLNISTSNEKDYAGGFVGQQSGSIIETCTVKNSNLSLQGKNFVGGFVGLARDSIIKGTLSGALDIETKLPKMNTESLLLGCSLSDTSVTVNSVNYAGGFAGGLANTAAVNCSATGSFAVSATESNAGGFAGIATLGWAANLGKEDTKKDLLGGVVDLVVKLLSSNPGAASSLLSLAGVNPSYILGCTVDAPLTVNGTDYVGGVTGRGDGVYIAPSSADYLSKVSYWRNSNQLYGMAFRFSPALRIFSVSISQVSLNFCLISSQCVTRYAIMAAANTASTASRTAGHRPIAPTIAVIRADNPLIIAGSNVPVSQVTAWPSSVAPSVTRCPTRDGSTVPRIKAPSCGSRLAASAASITGQLLAINVSAWVSRPAQSMACRQPTSVVPTAAQSTWPRISLMAVSTATDSVLNAANSPAQSSEPIIPTTFCPKVVQSVPCTAAISVFSRPMTSLLMPTAASCQGMLLMAAFRQAAMPLPKSVQPVKVIVKLYSVMIAARIPSVRARPSVSHCISAMAWVSPAARPAPRLAQWNVCIKVS